jgi:hypothetical protein
VSVQAETPKDKEKPNQEVCLSLSVSVNTANTGAAATHQYSTVSKP